MTGKRVNDIFTKYLTKLLTISKHIYQKQIIALHDDTVHAGMNMEEIMDQVWSWLFGQTGFTPHAYCMVWREDLIFLHASSDFAIMVSYFTIPFIIMRLRRINPNLLPRMTSFLFVAFILSCGLTHAMGMITLWNPIYGIASVFKILCAVASGATTTYMVANYKKLADIPSVDDLLNVQGQLITEIKDKNAAEGKLRDLATHLEERVNQRTTDLEDALGREKIARRNLEDVLRVRDLFVSSISHDFKTPLNAIIGFSEMILKKYHGASLDGKNREYLNHIHEAGLSLKCFVFDLVDVFRLQDPHISMKVTRFDFSALVVSVCQEFMPDAMNKAVKFSCKASAREMLDGDEVLCRRMISNLVSNALKYTDEGEVSVEVSSIGDGVQFYVSDTGRGIAPADQRIIFDAFHRVGSLEKAIESHGLGLAIVKSVVEKHQGNIDLWSKLGEGSAFTVQLRNQQLEGEDTAAMPAPEPTPA